MEYKDTKRQTGRTTRAILEAPEKALFICPTVNSIATIRHMAETLGRTDLYFRAATSLPPDQLKGLRRSSIIVDHAARLSEEALKVLTSLHE